MGKKLVFEENKDDRTMFENIFNGFHKLARPNTREDHKTTNRILEIFEEVSVEKFADDIEEEETEGEDKIALPVPGFSNADGTEPKWAPRARKLKEGRQYMIFEDHQFEFITKALSTNQTLPFQSKDVEAMWEFLDAAKKGSTKKLVAEEQTAIAVVDKTPDTKEQGSVEDED